MVVNEKETGRVVGDRGWVSSFGARFIYLIEDPQSPLATVLFR